MAQASRSSGLLGAYELAQGTPIDELGAAVDYGAAVGFVVISPVALYALGGALFSAYG